MKIAVCVKRVPDMDVRFRIGSDGASVDETGVKFDLNDFDAWAVEAAQIAAFICRPIEFLLIHSPSPAPLRRS